MSERTVCVFGCWDLLHQGHLNALEAARALGDRLIVGVFSDQVVINYKGQAPARDASHRCRMVQALACVDQTQILTEREYLPLIRAHQVQIYAIGEQTPLNPRHLEAFDYLQSNDGKVVRLPHTPNISSSKIRRSMRMK